MACWREFNEKRLRDGRLKLAGTSSLTTPRETTVTRPTLRASFEVIFMSNFKEKYTVAKALSLAKPGWLVGENPKRNDSVTVV